MLKLRTLKKGSTGEDVERLQHKLGRLDVDGDYGPRTATRVAQMKTRLGYLDKNINGTADVRFQEYLYRYRRRSAAMVARGVAVRRAQERARKNTTLRSRAHKVAQGLIGVMEEGGNNRGPMVNRIIRANGGTVGEPWCGDFVAYCYKLAGSKAVSRPWASVRLLGGVSGVRRTRRPKAGDLVRFTFDHVGMYVGDAGNGYIWTIEGNTGRSGAVSDSSTGGDGVYKKKRPKSLVNDYLKVLR